MFFIKMYVRLLLFFPKSGMKPNQADMKYLETAKRLELYGVDLHPCRDMENVEIYIGVGFHGIVIYRDRMRIGRFAWPKVLRISYKKNNFFLKIRPDYVSVFLFGLVEALIFYATSINCCKDF